MNPTERDAERSRSSETWHSRKSETWQIGALIVVMAAVGAIGWVLQLRDPLELDVAPLATLPESIGPWQSKEVPLEENVESILRADFNVQRLYVHPVGFSVGIYIGYYGTERGGRPEHTPWVCYPNAGWKIEVSRKLTVDEARGLRVNELEVEKDGERSLVHFWYRSYRRTGLLGPVDQVLDRFLNRMRHDRSDGALVRVSTRLEPGDLVGARSRLASLGGQLDALLDAHWPHEAPAS